MDVRYELHGTSFVWNEHKAVLNRRRHDGITFEQAAQVLLDPFLVLVDASRGGEAREAAIGRDFPGRLLFVVHVELDGQAIRIISARKATARERDHYDNS